MEISVDEALKKGVDAHRAGDLQGAERFYRTILEADPDHSDANHNMGVLAVGVGKMPEALPFFKKATLTNPSIHQYWLSYIESLNKLGDTKEAWHVLGKAKGFDLPQQLIDKMEAIISKQKLCINSDLLLLRDNGKFSDAISLAQKLLAKGKQDPEILSFIAQCHILNNDLENGELFLKKATEVDSSISSISWNKARLFLKKREFSKALETALKTKSHLSKKDESLAILGACYFSNGNYKAANEAIEKALSINPDNAEASVNKALILLKNGNKVDALENLIFAFDRKPHLRQIWEILMSLASELERYDQAISISEKIIEFDNQNAKAYAYLGECHSKIGNDIQAIEAFDQAIEINPNYADAHYNKGVCLNSLTEQQKAIECYKKAIKINPNYADAFYNLGVSYFEQGSLACSYDSYKKAIRINPDHIKGKKNWISTFSWYDPPPQDHSDKHVISHLNLKKMNPQTDKQGHLSNKSVESLLSDLFLNIKGLGLSTASSQIYRSNAMDPDCDRHMSIFNKYEVIPKFCFNCYKVQIEVRNIYELIKLYLVFDGLNLKENLTRKCMIELRPQVQGFYKGLIYCSGLDEAKNISKLLTTLIKKRLSNSLTAKIKHGCSEYAIKFPSFNDINFEGKQKMNYNHDWQNIEMDYDTSQPLKPKKAEYETLSGINLDDAIIIQNWISYGIGIGDEKAYELRHVLQASNTFIEAGRERIKSYSFNN